MTTNSELFATIEAGINPDKSEGTFSIEAQAALETLRQRMEHIMRLSNVGELYDGHDELNEDTHEENERLVTGALDSIYAILQGKYEE